MALVRHQWFSHNSDNFHVYTHIKIDYCVLRARLTRTQRVERYDSTTSIFITFGRLNSGRREDGKPHARIWCCCVHYTLQFVKFNVISSLGLSTHTRTCHSRVSLDQWIGTSRLCWAPIIISHCMQSHDISRPTLCNIREHYPMLIPSCSAWMQLREIQHPHVHY